MAFKTDINTLILVTAVENQQHSLRELDTKITEAYKKGNELRSLLLEYYNQKILLNDELNYLKILLAELEAKVR